jgi:hypothetical protein
MCLEIFCLNCTNFTKQELSALNKLDSREDILWVCYRCIDSIQNLQLNNQLLVQLKQDVENKFNEIEKVIATAVSTIHSSSTKIDTATNLIKSNSTSINTAVESVKKNSSENITVNMTKSFADILKGDSECTSVKGVFREVITEQRKEQVKEDEAKEERQKNIIIYKLGEEQVMDREARYLKDKDIIQKILTHLDLEEIEPKAILRLGNFDLQKHKDGKIRPIKIILHTKECRDHIMRNLYKMSNLQDESIKIAQLGYDLSEEERDVIKKTVDEAKTLSNSSTEFFWRVRGPPWALWLKKEKRRENQQTTTPDPS